MDLSVSFSLTYSFILFVIQATRIISHPYKGKNMKKEKAGNYEYRAR